MKNKFGQLEKMFVSLQRLKSVTVDGRLQNAGVFC
jgi:hypothetical protein